MSMTYLLCVLWTLAAIASIHDTAGVILGFIAIAHWCYLVATSTDEKVNPTEKTNSVDSKKE